MRWWIGGHKDEESRYLIRDNGGRYKHRGITWCRTDKWYPSDVSILCPYGTWRVRPISDVQAKAIIAIHGMPRP